MTYANHDVLLSWLQGRRPVGEPVAMNRREILPDLGWHMDDFCEARRHLYRGGFIEKLTQGDARFPTLVRVVRRLEERP